MTKTVLVTGSSGIGGAVTAALRRQGHRVLTVGRRGDVRADLTLLRDTDRAVREIGARADRLDAVVCCAGVLSTVAEHTDEGLERTLVLNYLSRYLLVRRLLPLLTPAGRVVLVANAGRYRDTLGDLADLNLRNGGRGLKISGRTQFANDLFAVELAARTSIAVSCLFPGLVATGVFQNARGVPGTLRSAMDALQRRIGADPAKAARTPVLLATVPEMASGFYGPSGRPLRVPARVINGRRAALWDASDELVRPWLDAAQTSRPPSAVRAEVDAEAVRDDVRRVVMGRPAHGPEAASGQKHPGGRGAADRA